MIMNQLLEEIRRSVPVLFSDTPGHLGGLYAPARYILSLGGKRLRPVLCLLAADMLGTATESRADAMNAALALEVFHNFTLVHDDIMDNASERRAQPTVHTRWDTNTAILSGDVMLIEAYTLLCKINPERLLPALDLFNRMARIVCEGQQLDMDYASREMISGEQYLDMISAKTAALIGASLALGALIAGASAETQAHIDRFGTGIGMAFQIQDDLLDCFGNKAETGKRTGGDIIENKKTLLPILAHDSASAEDRAALLGLYSASESSSMRPERKIAEVLDLFRKYEVEQKAIAIRDQYIDGAYEHLEAIDIAPPYREVLATLGRSMQERKG